MSPVVLPWISEVVTAVLPPCLMVEGSWFDSRPLWAKMLGFASPLSGLKCWALIGWACIEFFPNNNNNKTYLLFKKENNNNNMTFSLFV